MQREAVGMLVVGGFLVLLAFAVSTFQPHTSVSAQDMPALLCDGEGGELLGGTDKLTCILPDHTFLAFADGAWHKPTDSPSSPVANTTGMISATAARCISENDLGDIAVSEENYDRPAAVNFDTWPAATHYRTAINRDVRRGVNLANRYVLASWGCGESCVGNAVIDAKDGRILMYGLQTNRVPRVSLDSPFIDAQIADGTKRFVVTAGEWLEICQ